MYEYNNGADAIGLGMDGKRILGAIILKPGGQ
jgi:hypothetical protein